jgi:hypothetical protein
LRPLLPRSRSAAVRLVTISHDYDDPGFFAHRRRSEHVRVVAGFTDALRSNPLDSQSPIHYS